MKAASAHHSLSANSPSGAGEMTLHELVEESSFRLLENNSPLLTNLVGKLVAAGLTPEAVVEYFVAQTGFPHWRVVHFGCAASYLQRLNAMSIKGQVS